MNRIGQHEQLQSAAAAHSRRSHRKSRYGCRNCKNKRLKCDETKPQCTRCLKSGVQCDYVYSHPQHQPKKSPASMELVAHNNSERMMPDTTAGSMSLVAVDRSICRALGFDEPDRVPDSPGLTRLDILNCFITDTTRFIPGPKIKTIMRTGVIKTAFTNPHLMHTIMAVSCLYLNRVLPHNKNREVLEMYHWQRAINLYQKELTCSAIGPHNVDALISSCILLGMNELAPVGFEPRHSWVFTSNVADLNWLALQGGLRCLIEITGPYLDDCMWAPAFREAGDQWRPFSRDQRGRAGLHDELADLCGIDDETTSKTNTYHWPVQLLSRMLNLKPYNKPENYVIFVSFMGLILPDFINYLRRKDERALLILSWWMGLMAAVSSYQPWIKGRIIPECQAICMYLESTSTDMEILRLMKWPAKACGYHEQTPETFEDAI